MRNMIDNLKEKYKNEPEVLERKISYYFKETFIYIMENRKNGYYKIGHSKNPLFREKTLQSEEPDIVLIYKWRCYKSDEKIVHESLKQYRVRGEWFKLTDTQLLDTMVLISKLSHA